MRLQRLRKCLNLDPLPRLTFSAGMGVYVNVSRWWKVTRPRVGQNGEG